ncbi:MAG: hypothetical protein ACI9RO_001841 [Alteromonas macleodii]|jgi:hypothetical protein
MAHDHFVRDQGHSCDGDRGDPVQVISLVSHFVKGAIGCDRLTKPSLIQDSCASSVGKKCSCGPIVKYAHLMAYDGM